MLKLFKLFLLSAAIASLIVTADLARGQDVYIKDWPEAVPAVEYSAWAWNNRAGTRAELAGTTEKHCGPDGTITVAKAATKAEWDSHNQPAYIGAITYWCFGRDESFGILFRHDMEVPTFSLMTHEAGHALGCWTHLPSSTEHIMAPLVHLWAGLTVQDVDCGREGAHFPLYGPADVCWTELMPNFDLIAPAALGMYRRLQFVGDIERQEYRWYPGAWRDSNGPECDTVRVLPGGVIALDDVRSQHWQGSAEIVGDGNGWGLRNAIPR